MKNDIVMGVVVHHYYVLKKKIGGPAGCKKIKNKKGKRTKSKALQCPGKTKAAAVAPVVWAAPAPARGPNVTRPAAPRAATQHAPARFACLGSMHKEVCGMGVREIPLHCYLADYVP